MRCKIDKNIKLAKISNAYSTTNTMKFDTLIDTQKHLLWKQYDAWHCSRYTAARISDCINNTAFQELLFELDYFCNKSNEKVYIDLRDSLGYTDEIEKPSRNDSKLNVTIELKKGAYQRGNCFFSSTIVPKKYSTLKSEYYSVFSA